MCRKGDCESPLHSFAESIHIETDTTYIITFNNKELNKMNNDYLVKIEDLIIAGYRKGKSQKEIMPYIHRILDNNNIDEFPDKFCCDVWDRCLAEDGKQAVQNHVVDEEPDNNILDLPPQERQKLLLNFLLTNERVYRRAELDIELGYILPDEKLSKKERESRERLVRRDLNELIQAGLIKKDEVNILVEGFRNPKTGGPFYKKDAIYFVPKEMREMSDRCPTDKPQQLYQLSDRCPTELLQYLIPVK